MGVGQFAPMPFVVLLIALVVVLGVIALFLEALQWLAVLAAALVVLGLARGYWAARSKRAE